MHTCIHQPRTSLEITTLLEHCTYECLFLECSPGTYGTNCSSRCGSCKEQGDCHHVTGVCQNGCAAGYNGSKCDTGNWLFCVYAYLY